MKPNEKWDILHANFHQQYFGCLSIIPIPSGIIGWYHHSSETPPVQVFLSKVTSFLEQHPPPLATRWLWRCHLQHVGFSLENGGFEVVVEQIFVKHMLKSKWIISLIFGVKIKKNETIWGWLMKSVGRCFCDIKFGQI